MEKQGFVGIYYPGTYRTDRAIIASGGASCDEKLSVAMSRFLRDAGYNVLVLGFLYVGRLAGYACFHSVRLC